MVFCVCVFFFFQLKTNRQRNAERLLRQGAKWEKERLRFEEIDKQNELELKERQRQAFAMQDDFTRQNKLRGMDLLRYLSLNCIFPNS